MIGSVNQQGTHGWILIRSIDPDGSGKDPLF